MTKDEIVRDLAIKKVCPLSMEPQTAYEHNMVRQLTQFGLAVLDAVEQPLAPDGAHCLCGGEYYTDKVLGVVCCRCQAPRR